MKIKKLFRYWSLANSKAWAINRQKFSFFAFEWGNVIKNKSFDTCDPYFKTKKLNFYVFAKVQFR